MPLDEDKEGPAKEAAQVSVISDLEGACRRLISHVSSPADARPPQNYDTSGARCSRLLRRTGPPSRPPSFVPLSRGSRMSYELCASRSSTRHLACPANRHYREFVNLLQVECSSVSACLTATSAFTISLLRRMLRLPCSSAHGPFARFTTCSSSSFPSPVHLPASRQPSWPARVRIQYLLRKLDRACPIEQRAVSASLEGSQEERAGRTGLGGRRRCGACGGGEAEEGQ